MINQTSVKQTLGVDVAISAPMAEALQTWSLMYENKAVWLDKDVKSLNLPAAIAGEIARAATIEMEIVVSGSARADYLMQQINRIAPKLRQQVEYGVAKGGLMFKPYPNGKNIDIDFVQADCFYPISFDSNGTIVSCVFADQRTIGTNYFTRLEYHALTPLGCEIRNVAFKSLTKDTLGNQVGLESVEAWKGLQPEASINGVDKPLFAYFKYPLANNIDSTSPLGVSAYARAVELIHNADQQWSDLLWEFESGQRAIFVDELAFETTSEGRKGLPRKRLYRGMNATGNVGADELYEEWTPEFRDASITSGLDTILKRIEFTCGLAYGTLSDPQTVDKTATEITASKQRTYATIVDTQKSLESALNQLIWAMDVWVGLTPELLKIAPKGTYSVIYEWDDSVVNDKDLQMTQDRLTVGMAAMPKYIYLMRNYDLDESTAKQWVADNQAEQPQDVFQNQGA